jgi:hypothetical protein
MVPSWPLSFFLGSHGLIVDGAGGTNSTGDLPPSGKELVDQSDELRQIVCSEHRILHALLLDVHRVVS